MNKRFLCGLWTVFFLLLAAAVPVLSLSPAFAGLEGPFTEQSHSSGMTFSAKLSQAAVAPNAEIILYLQLRLVAPSIASAKERPPLAMALVIDRSGSMTSAGKLEFAKLAGKELVSLLRPGDLFSLVAYDSRVNVLFPLGPVRDKEVLQRILSGIEPGGNTFLSGGLEKGIEELNKGEVEGVRRVLLLSDGLANVGITGAENVAAIGAQARNRGISVSSMGLGRDYDENLMQLLAQRGGGLYNYVRESADLPAFFREELALAGESITKGLSLRFTPPSEVLDIKVYGYTTRPEGKEVIVEMGDMYSGEERSVLLRLKLRPGNGPAQALGGLNLNFALREDGKETSPVQLTLPLSVDVVNDEAERARKNVAAEAVIKPVQEEALLVEAEEAHVAAMSAMEKGNVKEARRIMQETKPSLAAAAPESPRIANKLQALQADENMLTQAQSDSALRKDMVKKSKSSLYQTSQGKTQDLLLQPGDKGARVERLQRLLTEQRFYSGSIDGLYTEEVKKAVAAFQKAKGLPEDGIAGQVTMQALGM